MPLSSEIRALLAFLYSILSADSTMSKPHDLALSSTILISSPVRP